MQECIDKIPADGLNRFNAITAAPVLVFLDYSILSAPSRTPTTLYLLLKKVIQSFSTPCSFSSRVFQSGLTFSALVDVLPRAREASCPAKTGVCLNDHISMRNSKASIIISFHKSSGGGGGEINQQPPSYHR